MDCCNYLKCKGGVLLRTYVGGRRAMMASINGFPTESVQKKISIFVFFGSPLFYLLNFINIWHNN